MVEEAQCESDTATLVAAYGQAEDDTKRGEIKDKLAKALEKQFDAQQKRRDHELKLLDEQLKKLREWMDKRTNERQTIIDKRLEQLVREADGLGWTTPPLGACFGGLVNPAGQ
jgi:hypothetical protein